MFEFFTLLVFSIIHPATTLLSAIYKLFLLFFGVPAIH